MYHVYADCCHILPALGQPGVLIIAVSKKVTSSYGNTGQLGKRESAFESR